MHVRTINVCPQDQLEADEDLSLKQRLALAGGSVVEGGGEHTKKISL